MSTLLIAYIIVHVLELACWLPPLWRWRRVLLPLIGVLIVVSIIVLGFYSQSFGVALLAIVALYRLVNVARILAGRMQPDYLKRTTWRTTLILLLITVGIALFALLFREINVTAGEFWNVFLFLQLGIAIALLLSTLHHAYHMRPPRITNHLPDKDLPTLTVAIPARNETEDLQQNLKSLVASDYPKLEILVLDDCSTIKRTPEIIRSFAQDGVRFIMGEPTKEGWLAKNQAYQRLLEEANGDLILFCGADVRFEPQTLRNIVLLMLDKKKSMMSIMPRNILPRFLQLDASLIQPMRYAWEIALPRKMFKRPPVLSTCWVAKRDFLLSAGGLSAVTRSIVPESYFARHAVRHDGYGFRYTNQEIGLTSHKAISDQRDTATRTKYPQLHRRPELVMILTIGELFGLVMPFMFLIAGVVFPEIKTLLVVSASTCALLITWYLTVCSITYRQPDLRSMLSLPFAALLDVALLNYSMLKYEFSVVLWKDRNVCVPVMRVEAKLPKLS